MSTQSENPLKIIKSNKKNLIYFKKNLLILIYFLNHYTLCTIYIYLYTWTFHICVHIKYKLRIPQIEMLLHIIQSSNNKSNQYRFYGNIYSMWISESFRRYIILCVLKNKRNKNFSHYNIAIRILPLQVRKEKFLREQKKKKLENNFHIFKQITM